MYEPGNITNKLIKRKFVKWKKSFFEFRITELGIEIIFIYKNSLFFLIFGNDFYFLIKLQSNK